MSFADYAAFTIHDVKNRLAMLAGRAEARGDRDMLRDALDAAGRLTSLLACYKAEQGWLGVEVDAGQPDDLVGDLVAEFGQLAGIAVRREGAAGDGLFFYDASLVRLVLSQALHNALRHAQREIVLGVEVDAEWLTFTVRDDGPGYPPELLCDAGSNEPRPLHDDGTGLGIYLAHRVAALHQNNGLAGSVELRNAPGACFTLRLPR
jgi:signal transduction histidine kinase